MTTKITTTPSPLEVVDKINVLVDESSTNATNITSAKNASITGLSVSGKVITYTKGNGTTGTITTQDTNTTYSAMTASEATTGTATTARSITAKVLHDKIKELALSSSDSLPIGTIVPFSGSTVPSGYLTCNGAAISRTTYADLFAVIGTTYGRGNGSTTFNLPNLGNNIVSDVATGDLAVKGNGKSLGFTNGRGDYGAVTVISDGRFAECAQINVTLPAQQSGGPFASDYVLGITTDGSQSGMVVPMTATKTTVKYIIKAFSSVTNTGNVDLQDIASDYERVNTEIANTKNSISGISDYIVESYRNGTQWYRKWKSGLLEQGGLKGETSVNSTITLHKAFSNTIYTVLTTVYEDVGNASSPVYNKTNTNFQTLQDYPVEWYAYGQGA